MNTNDQNAIETEQMQEGLAVLNNLAQEEYHKDLDSILADPARTQEEGLLRVGRLVGVVLKEPFATAVPIDPTTSYTGAYRGWELNIEAFDASEKQATWQYGVLEALLKEYQGPASPLFPPWPPTVSVMAENLQNEWGFFAQLATSTRKYICGNPALRQKIDAEVKASQQGGGAVQLISKGTASTFIATTLIQQVPWLSGLAHDPSGLALLSGLVLLIMSIGLDAFCDWSEQLQHGPPPAEKEK